MKRSKLTTFTVLVLLVTMVALIMVSGTYAKYTTTLDGTATATVAKFAVGGLDSATFDLFGTLTEADSTASEEHVAEGTIAPGTGGSFEIELTNDSDVAVTYALSIEETSNDNNVPIEYSTDGSTYYSADDFSTAASSNGTLDIGSTTQQTETVTIWWRWVYEAGTSTVYADRTNADDTELGEMTTSPTVEVKASVVFTQVD